MNNTEYRYTCNKVKLNTALEIIRTTLPCGIYTHDAKQELMNLLSKQVQILHNNVLDAMVDSELYNEHKIS